MNLVATIAIFYVLRLAWQHCSHTRHNAAVYGLLLCSAKELVSRQKKETWIYHGQADLLLLQQCHNTYIVRMEKTQGLRGCMWYHAQVNVTADRSSAERGAAQDSIAARDMDGTGRQYNSRQGKARQGKKVEMKTSKEIRRERDIDAVAAIAAAVIGIRW